MYEKICPRIYQAIWGEHSEFPIYLTAVSMVGVMAAIGLKMLGH